MTREDILNRYRHLRAISTQHHGAAMAFLPRQAMLEQVKRLGIAQGRRIVVDSEEEMTLVFDLLLYAARDGRTRALDRYASATPLPPGSDEALMLDAMRRARFSLWRVDRRHETAGLIVTDLVRGVEAWILDEGMEASASEGMAIATRICVPDSFAMTCGVIVPVSRALVEEAVPASLVRRRGAGADLADDPRFATAIYRTAIEAGVMERVAYQ